MLKNSFNHWLAAPVWDLAFRPFFLAAALLSVLSLSAWGFLLNSLTDWQPVLMNPVLWHVHEMLFGFALSIAVSFLLTAVQTWTGLRSVHGYQLMLLLGIWLSVRFLLWQPWWGFNALTFSLLMSLQLIWWGMIIFFFGQLLWRAKSQRNYLFIPVLCVIALLNLSFLYSAIGQDINQALHLSHSAILFFAVMISVIAGRVIPMFTRNGCRMAGINVTIRNTEKTDRLLIILSLIGAVSFLLNGWIELPYAPGWVLLSVGLLHTYRWLHWKPLSTVSIPLLWSLQLSYLCLAIGLVLLAISLLTDVLSFSSALHLITVGTMGGMILAMISRVSLGHTGRPLQVHRWMILAFLLIFVGAAARVVLPLLDLSLLGWNITIVCWCSAFGIFLYRYFPILTRA